MIKIESLSKKFSSKVVLSDFSLSLNFGEIHGFVGENGAGKTTLFNCIAGLESYNGTISFTKGKLKNTTGFLETNPQMISKITGLEYIELLCAARNVQLKNVDEKNIFDLPLSKYAETYSTGMRKKLALTAILLQKNEVFIFDEPFSGIDIGSNMILTELIFELKKLKKIVLVSSHIFASLHEICDYLHYLKDGKLSISVQKKDFNLIETDMKQLSIRAKIDKLNLH